MQGFVEYLAINPQSDKLNNLIFHPLEVVSRYRDPQLQVGENYSHLFHLRPNICKFRLLNKHSVLRVNKVTSENDYLQMTLSVWYYGPLYH